MKKYSYMLAVVLFAALTAISAFAQRDTVRGTVKGDDGKPIVGADIELSGKETGAKYSMKTGKKGEFAHIGVADGIYHLTVTVNGQLLYQTDIGVRAEAPDIDINLKQAKVAAQERATQGLTEEQKKQFQEEVEKRQREATLIKGLNQKLAEAGAAEQAGNVDQAIALLAEAAKMDPARHVIWGRLGQAYISAGNTATDRSVALNDYTQAAEAYGKAIALKPNDGGYHNNLGQAYARTGRTDEALREYATAAQVDPSSAGLYYFNLGAVLSNQAMKATDNVARDRLLDQANEAFDKSLSVDPGKAEAYYQKGVNLFSKAILKDNKIVAPPGTAEALNKYLQVAPNGPFAASAKEILASIGAQIETQFKKKK